jgi:hypothetical protein
MKGFKLMTISFIILCFIPLSLSPNKTFWDDSNDEFSKKRKNVRNLFDNISTVNLLNGLNLTMNQMKKILNLARKAQNIKQDFLRENVSSYMDALDRAEKSYKKLFNEIMKGDPARGYIEREAMNNNHNLKKILDDAVRNITNEFTVLDQELSKILTPEQQQVIKTFNPCLIPPKDLKNPVRVGQASSNDRAVKIMRRLRNVPDLAWNRRKYRIISNMVERFSQYRSVMTEDEKEREVKRLLLFTEKIRAMSDTDFEFDKEKLAEELKPENRVKELLEEIQQRVPHQRKPKASKAVRYLLNQRIIPILEERIERTV